MKALILGAGGFVAHYLLEHIRKDYGWETYATLLPSETLLTPTAGTYALDILDAQAVEKLLAQIRPDYIFHLAAQSSVALAWKKPELTVEINLVGTLHILEAMRRLGLSSRILLIGSGEEYGDGEADATDENAALHPKNLYAVTKAAQTMMGRLYAEAFRTGTIMVRPFNHIGPTQKPEFVMADFCRQIVQIEKGGHPPVLRVGNLDARRDFTDVRDVVRAYTLLMGGGLCGEIYNVGSGRTVSIREILKLLLSMSEKEITVEVDPEKFRPLDSKVLCADTGKLNRDTGWRPEIPLERTAADTLRYWREIL
ncbi:MAG: GDP-mannose 4,6-dehydratase [Provencibacterium sp.]|nr:GDP-mannose 4,6-dehydratase [Provencibacterium sp.]